MEELVNRVNGDDSAKSEARLETNPEKMKAKASDESTETNSEPFVEDSSISNAVEDMNCVNQSESDAPTAEDTLNSAKTELCPSDARTDSEKHEQHQENETETPNVNDVGENPQFNGDNSIPQEEGEVIDTAAEPVGQNTPAESDPKSNEDDESRESEIEIIGSSSAKDLNGHGEGNDGVTPEKATETDKAAETEPEHQAESEEPMANNDVVTDSDPDVVEVVPAKDPEIESHNSPENVEENEISEVPSAEAKNKQPETEKNAETEVEAVERDTSSTDSENKESEIVKEFKSTDNSNPQNPESQVKDTESPMDIEPNSDKNDLICNESLTEHDDEVIEIDRDGGAEGGNENSTTISVVDEVEELSEGCKDVNLEGDAAGKPTESEGDPGMDASRTETGGSDDEESMPMIRMNSNIFEAQNDDEDDDDEGMDPDAIQSMMQMEMDTGEDDENFSKDKTADDESPDRRGRPRRQAAVVASNTIKQISTLEQGVGNKAKKGDDDVEYISTVSKSSSSRPTSGERRTSAGNAIPGSGDKQRCHQCKTLAPSTVVVRQYGTDVHLCSNKCFNTFRNPDPAFRPLPCAKCGMLSRDTETNKLYYWETMNFCTDLCVGNFQLQIGSVCSTCSKKTPWTCMGKYCVRFGSDIRQFCTAACLESYKRNARVCFHCQLDIKKLGNVIIANVPFKSTPKEFCSQECVEQYRDSNSGGTQLLRPPMVLMCYICKSYKELYKELTTAIMSYKVCSAVCWEKLQDQQCIRIATKCESCKKYINMDSITLSPSFYVSSEKKAFGFCSATCKNVFVLKTRQIRPCTTCQVKKYSYDLIQYPGASPAHGFSVCSLNCLPRPSHHIYSLKTKITDPSYVPPPPPPVVTIITTASQTVTQSPSTHTSLAAMSTSGSAAQPYRFDLRNGQLSCETGVLDDNVQEVQVEGISSLGDGTFYVNGDNSVSYEGGEVAQYYLSTADDGVTIRQLGDGEVLQLSPEGTLHVSTMADGGTDEVYMEEPLEEDDEFEIASGEGEDVNLEDERWGKCDEFVVIRHPEPVEQRNKGCQVKPYPNEVQTQTDFAELADMPRIQPRVKVLIVPVPVIIPFPVYTCAQPVPVPFPIGIPVPIPIPIIKENKKVTADAETATWIDVSSASSSVLPENKECEDEEEKLEAISESEKEAEPVSETPSVSGTEENTVTLHDDVSEPILPPEATSNVSSPLTSTQIEISDDHPSVINEDDDSSDVAAMLEAAMSPLTPPAHAENVQDLEASADLTEEPMFEGGLSPFTSVAPADVEEFNSEFVPNFDTFPELDADDVEMMDTSEPLDLLEQITTAGIEMDSECADPESIETDVEAIEADPLAGHGIGHEGDSEPNAEIESSAIVDTETETQPQTPTISPANIFPSANSNSPKNLPNSYSSTGSPFLGTSSPAPGSPSVTGKKGNRAEYGLRAWKIFFGEEDPATLAPEVLSEKLKDWTLRGTKSKGDRYEPDVLFYFFLGIQNHLRAAGRLDQIFYETGYTPFLESLTAYAEQEMSKGRCIAKVDEDHVWEANELGPLSPGILLFTLVYYIYKHFGLKTWEEHGALQCSQIRIQERKNSLNDKLEKYVTITGITNSDDELVEVVQDPENPYRCMVKLLEFYTAKSESKEGNFYKSLRPIQDPRDFWYSDQPLSQMDLYRMLVRAQMICFDV